MALKASLPLILSTGKRPYQPLKNRKKLLNGRGCRTGYDPVSHYLYIAKRRLGCGLNYGLPEHRGYEYGGSALGDIKIDSNRLEAMVIEQIRNRELFLNATEEEPNSR